MSASYAAPSSHVGKLIDEGLRRSSQLNQTRLAERCGVSRSYIVKLKNGKIRNPTEDILICLAASLDQDVDDYRMAILADSGELPEWDKVWANQVEAQEGVHLSTDDRESIRRYARALVKQRRGKTT